jgi:hypothetical protein
MNHSFVSATLDARVCARCGYNEIAHGPLATCEACGVEENCEFLGKLDNPKKMLLCAKCTKAEMDLAVRQTAERVKAHEAIKSSADYFNANIPAIMDIVKVINDDETITNKPNAIAVAVKDRLVWLQSTILSKSKELSILDHEKRETLVYLNHMLKDISEAKQVELGLKDITYKQPDKKAATKKNKAPSVKGRGFDKTELRRVANMFHIPEEVLQAIVVRKQLTIEAAAKLYIQTNVEEE